MRKIKKAIIELLIYYPFFSFPVLNLEVEENNNRTQTMATNGEKIFYNKKFVENADDKDLITIIAHEALHSILLHPLRVESRDITKANIAADYVVNLLLQDSGFFIPEGALIDEKYRDMDFIQVYNLLPDCKKMPAWGGELLPSPHRTSAAKKNEEIKWQKIMKQAQVSGKLAGKNSDNIDRIVDAGCQAKINYKEILSKFLSEISKKDWSWRKPRQFGDCFLPRLEGKKFNIGIAIDTSGSIDDNLLKDFIGELNYLCKFNQVSATIVYFDNKIQKSFELDDFAKMPLPKGGGGTDYKPIFNFFENCDNTLSGLIIYTDGFCDSFAKNVNDFQTVWILPKKIEFTPPYGEIIFME